MIRVTFSRELVAANTEYVISVGEARLHCKIDQSEDNNVVQGLINTAMEFIEDESWMKLNLQTWRLYLDQWPSKDMGWWDGVQEGSIMASQVNEIQLPMYPLNTLTSIKTYDAADVATVWAASNYIVDKDQRPPRVITKTMWPAFTRLAKGIEFEAVFGFAPDAIPFQIKQAALLTVAHLYQNRGDENVKMPESAKRMIKHSKMPRL